MSTIRIPAGRSYRRPNTKFVDASPEKGIIEVIPDSGMVSLVWRNKETDRAENELLIFPGEAVFERAKQDPTGRSWVLRFVESKQTHFVSWLDGGRSCGNRKADISSGSSAAPSACPTRAP